ncbi:CaiB/BaiF CoA-transferase family protein [Mycolicibacterium litorale]|uniref:CoA transferase n=1 Tax=Mycolicibacterium litorale TaxID=758802 RepID=A0AAD1IPJ1_9MYCO|nr:CoA transferase [Mycolicibacterium litorale]MCV7417500.1 CoA transferase [Mycolicibacterium litorale]TDY05289.1 crotonobetainyl-CoA:carnitine CoA-transferase CaiB-like acyl-CoA transferase [Mycolicibacterium litorale]BBY18726.1 CoA transferase [Mycolicibacterium litorale]
MGSSYDPPLAGIRILDLSSGPMTAVGRLLADLGAHVTAVELAGVTGNVEVGPRFGPVALATAINRLGVAPLGIDASTPAGRQRWDGLVDAADILIEDTRPGSAAERLLGVDEIRAAHPGLIVLSLSDFGRDNDFSGWQSTTPVLHALTSELSRSGMPGREPLVPPGEQLPYHVAAAQAAVAVLSVLLDRLRTGAGDRIDFAIVEGAMQALDPPFGTMGTASAGVPVAQQNRNWAAERLRYPITACRDGYIRICLLAKRQWHGMFEWMGRPEEFADPRFEGLRERLTSASLWSAIGAFCADKTRADLEQNGQKHGVPTAAVLSMTEALTAEQVTARGFFGHAEFSPGLVAPVPRGVVEVDGQRAYAVTAPVHAERGPTSAPILAQRRRTDQGLPLEGLRVLDLGVIVVGADTGRLFGDLGADVIKIENAAFPDGMRPGRNLMNASFAGGHRNKRAIGIDLRSAEGRTLAHRLVEEADVVLTNFKPGVAAGLAMDHDTLMSVNPGIVVVDSSAFGPTGPWAQRLGYGPLVRAAAGFTKQWVYPSDPDEFCDTVTVYPDHVSARIGVVAALSLLVRRERTGQGGAASIAQSEVMLSHLAAEIAGEALARDGHERSDAAAYDAPWGLFRADGEDAWLAVTVRDDDDWRALCGVLERPDLAGDPELATKAGRDRYRTRIDQAVSEWTCRRSPADGMILLQAAGVPAGAVMQAADLPQWEYYAQRRAFREELHPHGKEPYVLENAQLHSERIADPPLGQAPLLGEQTVEIATTLLGLDDAAVAGLLERGVLQTAPEARRV